MWDPEPSEQYTWKHDLPGRARGRGKGKRGGGRGERGKKDGSSVPLRIYEAHVGASGDGKRGRGKGKGRSTGGNGHIGTFQEFRREVSCQEEFQRMRGG